jgi:hypothetical protein
MKFSSLIETYPQYTPEQIKQLVKTFTNIKGRCNSKSLNYKNYWEVDFKFKDFNEFVEFIDSEKEKNRDYFTIDHPHVSRLFDKGEYSFNNCIIRSRAANVRESGAKSYKLYNHADGKTNMFTSLRLFFKHNKEVLNISYSTLIRRIKKNELITCSNGEYSHLIKITEL